MKKFVIFYAYIVTDDAFISAKNKKTALEKFRSGHPEAQVTDILEITEELGYC